MMTQSIRIRRTFKYRLYRNDKKDATLRQQIDVAGRIWNHCLALYNRYYRLFKRHVSEGRMKNLIKRLRKIRKYNDWQKLGSQAVQDVTERLERAYQKFFKRQGGLPRFKKVKKYKSFTLKQTAGWKLLPDIKVACDKNKQRGVGLVRIGKTDYKFIKHRELKGIIKTVTVKRDVCGNLWICFSVVEQLEIPDLKLDTVDIGGFDLGFRTFLVDHDGTSYSAPENYKANLAQIRRLSRSISRKVKGSRNRRRARWQLNRSHIRIADKRRDFHYQLAHELCKQYDVLVFEDLNIDGMKRLWGRKVSDLGFAQFIEIIQWVALKQGKIVHLIDRFIPTTQSCSSCGHRQKLTLKQRVFECQECDLILDRDYNAAINIQQAGASAYTERGLCKTS